MIIYIIDNVITHSYIYIYTYTHTHTHTHVYIYMLSYAYIYVLMRRYIYAYTYTHKNIHEWDTQNGIYIYDEIYLRHLRLMTDIAVSNCAELGISTNEIVFCICRKSM